MKRLKKWIDEVRAEKNEYAAGYWMCRYSGDTVEFLIHPHVVFQTDRYKHTVIRIGMLLKRLSEKMDETGYVFHIQTFPSLDDLKTVATIRLNVNISQGKSKNQSSETDSGTKTKQVLTSDQKLQQRAKKHNLQLIEIIDEDNLQQLEEISDKLKAWYVIGGYHDNPFAWLHAGFLAEELCRMACRPENGDMPAIISGPELSDIKNKLKVSDPPPFTHALIALRSEPMKSSQV